MTKRNLRLKESELLYEKRIRDLESVNESLKCDVEELRSKLADVSITSSVGTLQSSREFSHKSSYTKDKAMSSRSKSNMHSMYSREKHKSGSSVKQLDGEIYKIKAQKVKLQCKVKLDSMHFRLTKASLEKEVLQLKKELRKSEFEKHVLAALNKRQKMILQLKNTQALTALKRLKSLLQSKKISSNKNNGQPKGTNSRIQEESSDESKLLIKLNKIHSAYERQMKEIAEEVKRFSLEADLLKAELEGEQNSFSASCDSRINQTPMDSELKELKEEFNKLSILVSQMEMTKSQLCETDQVQVEPAEKSVSVKTTNNKSTLDLSQMKISEETLYKPAENSVSIRTTNIQSNLDLSQPKTTEEKLRQPAENSISSKNTEEQPNMELSQPITAEETLHKTAENSISSKSTNDQSNLELSQPKTSDESLSKPAENSISSKNTEVQSNLELSEPKTSEGTLCEKEKMKAEMCCSCTKKSLCKTRNCKCRANGSGCGSSCGCLASKCSNRDDVKSDKLMQVENGIRHEKGGKKQPLREIHNIQEGGKVGEVKKMQKPVSKK